MQPRSFASHSVGRHQIDQHWHKRVAPASSSSPAISHRLETRAQRKADMGSPQDGSGDSGTGSQKKLVLVVGVALIERKPQARVLLAQRPPGKANAGLWEFPGGKVDAGETPEGALARELQEELGVHVQTSNLKPLSFASWPYPGFHLLMPLYECDEWEGQPNGLEGQAIVWATAEELAEYELTPADVPLVPDVLRALQR